ncbi:antibiotic biosynthesis monooxygenase family protein [Thermodesulfobacteriota bacterium]
MYVRIVFLTIKEGKMDELRDVYSKEVIPTVHTHKGNRFVHLLECRENINEALSITAWDTEGDLEQYLGHKDFERLDPKFSPFYDKEPVIKSYEVTASSDPLILRIF